jgi:hypothetical protein
MMSAEWLGLAGGAAMLVLWAVLAWLGLRGGKARRVQANRFVCPELGVGVECRMEQDLRTGQWKHVDSCSAFADPARVTCDQECARILNLGLRLTPAERH